MQKFSIILPVRNGGSYVKECVNSILAQPKDDYNLIVLDNASTDGTFEWLASLRNDKIILYKSGRDLSIEENWARIKDIPRGEFMTMIGHDDLLYPDYLEEMSLLIKQHPSASLYQTHFTFINENGGHIKDCISMVDKLEASEFLTLQMTRRIDSTGTGYMMRSKDFDELGGMPTNYPRLIFADFQLWISLMLRSHMVISEKKCFAYRIHQSVSTLTNGMDYQAAFFLYIDFLIDASMTHAAVRKVLDKFGKQFLLDYCQALSHRLLKTPIDQRKIHVSDIIKKIKNKASLFIPNQNIHPEYQIKTLAAEVLDSTSISRNLFQAFKRIG